MNSQRYYTAQEAAGRLGIQPETLYAYVSRGLIHSEPAPGQSRARRYRAEDVERLLARKEQRRDPARVAEEALHWGAPVLESALTLIAGGRFYYRGHDALALARRERFERVVALLWLGDLAAGPMPLLAGAPAEADLALPEGAAGHQELALVERFQAVLLLAAARDATAYDLRPPAVVRVGARILSLLGGTAAGRPFGPEGMAAALQRAWAPDISQAEALLNSALILCADHELNASSFTARVVAGAQATPYQVVLAGLAALQGRRHGGYTERVATLFREAESAENARATLAARLRRGEAIPGFGHVLYPEGDPRARLLLDQVAGALPGWPAVELAQALAGAAADLVGDRPTLDFALVALAEALDLPAGSALALFALGRAAGWIAHALEQYETGHLIRPRARYAGPLP
ncbi:MAG: citrate synthase family protein [Chloroflexi bacterium]|nr:citrate synthase family protein [Chloroflexota bacterium]MCI0576353.1 citrate synthase family protein [Chloroflexota bacterium]MCI0646186.1 citrate synthase family protein [Chloroflexota bacterium]MCI0726752.1 citrate synthase family protein [Chloroflexota bacterium]